MQITKRDGRVIEFDKSKIVDAIFSAAKSVGGENKFMAHVLSSVVEEELTALNKDIIDVEEIQDIVEKVLIENGKAKTAKAYILYRQQRSQHRSARSVENQVISELLFTDAEDSDEKRENANIDGNSTMGAMLKIGGTITKEYNLRNLIRKGHAQMHMDGKIHIHDLDFMALCVNCIQIPLGKLLDNGFNTGHGSLRTPATIGSAATLMCIAIQSSQNDFFGGQGIPALDYDLAPYVAKSFIRNCASILEIVNINHDNQEELTLNREIAKKYFISPLDEYIMETRSILNKKGYKKIKSVLHNALMQHYPSNKKFYMVDPVQIVNEKMTKVFDLAYERTQRDTLQAMEATIHNLCTLNCLPGDEELWVYDLRLKRWCIYEARVFHKCFEKGRFMALSVNKSTGEVEMKEILNSIASENNKKLVRIKDASGAISSHTFDHRHLTMLNSGELVYEDSRELKYTTIPRKFKIPSLTTYKEVYVGDNSIRGHRLNTPYQDTIVPYTKELAELLGYYVADGAINCNESSLCYGFDTKVAVEHIVYLCEKAFGFTPVINKTTRENSKGEIVLHNLFVSLGVNLTRMFKQLAGHLSPNKHIPDFIMHGDEEIQNAFIRAYLTCDGTRRKDIEFSTTSKYLVYDFKLLFASRGELLHVGSLNMKDTTNPFMKNTLYTCILGTKATERLGLEDMCDGVTSFEIPNYDLTHAIKICKEAKIPWGNLPMMPRRHGGTTLRYSDLENMNIPPKIESTINRINKVFRIPITSIETVEEIPEVVYDITVNDNENFMLASGHIVHNSRAGGQVPFSSVNTGTDTSTEGHMVTESLFKAIDAGLGQGETAVFPIAIMKLKKGITDEGSPNHDLFKLACKTSAKRLFPNFVNLDAPFNLQYYKEGHPETEVATMGCADKDEIVIWRSGDSTEKNMCTRITTFEQMWLYLKSYFVEKEFSPNSHYFECETTNYRVEIWDSHANSFVLVRKFIFNRGISNWRMVTFSNGRVLKLTGDHPLPVIDKGRTKVDDLQIGDRIPPSSSYPAQLFNTTNDIGDMDKSSSYDYFWMLGMTICDAALDRSSIVYSVGPDEIELRDKIMDCAEKFIYPNCTILQPVNKSWKLQERQEKGRYFDISFHGVKESVQALSKAFNGTTKANRHIPEEVMVHATRNQKLAFFAGMIDADGYINNQRPTSRVQIGSTNKALALMQAMLAEILGCQAKIYVNHYNASDKSKVRYLVEFFMPEDMVPFIQSKKKKEHLGNFEGIPKNSEDCTIMSIEKLSYEPAGMSFDVETESDRFDISMVQSHNCRTRVIGNVFDPNNEITPGRGNLFPTTINLPYLALELKEFYANRGSSIAANDFFMDFISYLDSYMERVFEHMDDRFEIVAKRKAKNYPFAMGQKLYLGSEDLEPDDEIREVIKHGTLVTGFIGLAETLVVIFGKHHGEDEFVRERGFELIKFMNDKVARHAKKTTMNYSFMASPAEGACGRLLKATRKRFGVIKGVTDHEYLTNSFHIPVYYPISAAKKIAIEAPFHALCPAG